MILACPNCGARFRVQADALGPSGRAVRCSQCHHQWRASPRDLKLEPRPVAPKPKPPAAAPAPKPAAPKPAKAAPKPPPPPVAAPPEPPPPPPEEPIEFEPLPLPPDPATATPMSDAAADAQIQSETVLPLEEEAPPPKATAKKPPKRSILGRVAAAIGWLLFVLVLGAGAGLAYMSDQVMEEWPATKGVYAFLGFDVPPPGSGLRLSSVNSSRTTLEGVPALVVEGKITNTTPGRRVVPPLRGSLRDANDKELQSWTFSVPTPRLEGGESTPFRTEVRQPSAQATGLSIAFIGQP